MVIKAWHFVNGTLRDGQPVPPDGETLEYDGTLELCKSGLHASRRVLDSLEYSPGTTCCRVLCGGDILEGDDKLVCSERTILWRVDAAKILKQFARRCALDVVHLWNPPPAVLEFLHGDQSKAAETAAEAAEAAWEATATATAEAARTAAWAAAEAWAAWATWSAEWSAEAAGAARTAARTAATAAAIRKGAAVTRESQNALLEKMLLKT